MVHGTAAPTSTTEQPLGSVSNDECRIDSIAQAGLFCRAPRMPNDHERPWKRWTSDLFDVTGKLIQLLDPPSIKIGSEPRLYKGYVPVFGKIGGNTLMQRSGGDGLRCLGDSNRASGTAQHDQPDKFTRALQEHISIYKVEPYVIAADVYAVSPHTGRAVDMVSPDLPADVPAYPGIRFSDCGLKQYRLHFAHAYPGSGSPSKYIPVQGNCLSHHRTAKRATHQVRGNRPMALSNPTTQLRL